jgi:hypothetical protein
MNNEFIWACNNLIETCRKVTRPICKLTNKPCICSKEKYLFVGFEIDEYENCPAFKKNPSYYISNEEREKRGLLNFVP